MFFKETGFKPDSRIIKKMSETQIKKEKCLFLSMCSIADEEMILERRPLTIEDFGRISYLLQTLGLENYCVDFQMCHADLLEQLANQIQNETELEQVDIANELSKREQWFDDFIQHLVSDRMKKYISEFVYF